MNNYELKRYSSSHDVKVVCADDLPGVVNKHQFWIVNTDECRGKGLHWVVFHFPSKGSLEFFDSLGNPPEHYHRRFQSILIFNGPRYKYIDSRIQSETFSLCGQYCIFYILQRIKGRSMDGLVYDFNDLNTHANDRLVSNYINDIPK